MSEFTITVPTNRSTNPSLVFLENKETVTVFHSHPTTLRKIIFWIGDVVYPGWYENNYGRATYEKYAKDAEDGKIEIFEKNFLDVAWPKVQAHLQVDQIQMFDITKQESK